MELFDILGNWQISLFGFAAITQKPLELFGYNFFITDHHRPCA